MRKAHNRLRQLIPLLALGLALFVVTLALLTSRLRASIEPSLGGRLYAAQMPAQRASGTSVATRTSGGAPAAPAASGVSERVPGIPPVVTHTSGAPARERGRDE